MKRLLFALGFVLMSFTLAVAGETNSKDEDVVQKELKKYEDECSQKTYPKDFDGVSMYNDDIKHLDYAYHQCLKEIIVTKIKEIATEEDATKMVKSLELFQEGILNFYWDLYNREDFGVIGRGMNDAALGRYYEKILEDIIHFQSLL